MVKKIEDEAFVINYKNCLKDEPLYALAMKANDLGLAKKKIESIRTCARFEEGLQVIFEFKQPID